MNVGSSSSIQATPSSSSETTNLFHRQVRTFADTYAGKQKILQNEHPDNAEKIHSELSDLVESFVESVASVPATESGPEKVYSPDGKWVAWRDVASEKIICKPADAEGPLQRFSAQGCERFSFCENNQYLILPKLRVLSSEEVQVFLAEQAALRKTTSDNMIVSGVLGSFSGVMALVSGGAEAAILQGLLFKGTLLKLGALLIAPVWLTGAITVITTLGSAGALYALIENHCRRRAIMPLPNQTQNNNPQVQIDSSQEQNNNPQVQSDSPPEPLAETQELPYQRIALHFEPTRADLPSKKSISMTIKGVVSFTAFSADKAHFFMVIDQKIIQQWSTKAVELQKSIDVCKSSESEDLAAANKPTAITEVLPSAQGKWLLLAEATNNDNASGAKMWLYSREDERIQSHFELTIPQDAQFVFSPSEKWLAVLEGGKTILCLCTESGAFKKKPLDNTFVRIRELGWQRNELRAIGIDNSEWIVIPSGETLHLQPVKRFSAETLRFSSFS